MELSQRLMDLSTYSSNVADGIITPGEFMNSPASIFGTNVNFFNNSVPKALFEASRSTQMYNANIMNMNRASNGQYGAIVDPSNPSAINVNQFSVFNAFFKQALEAAGKAEAAKIKKMETEIQQQQQILNTQLAAAKQELDSAVKAEEDGIKNATPKYA